MSIREPRKANQDSRGGGGVEKIESADEVGLEQTAMDDSVEEAFFQEELGALEAFWEFLTYGLLDNAGAGEADECAGFGYVQVAEHGEAGGDAAGGGIGEHADVGDAGRVQLRQGGGDFGHLHEAYHALHHACSAGGCDDDKRLAAETGAVRGASNGFADHRAHGTSDESVLHGADDDLVRAEAAGGVEDGVVEAGLRLSLLEPLLIGLDVGEVERVGGAQAAIHQLIARLEQHVDALTRADAEMVLAFGANVEVGQQIGLPDDRATGSALDPQTLGAHPRLRYRRALQARPVLPILALEPGHETSLKPVGS